MTINTDTLAAEMLAGLEGVTPGPWRPSRFGFQIVSDFKGPAWQSVVELRTKASEPDVEREAAVQTAIAYHLARCSPPNIRALLAERSAMKAEIERLREALTKAADQLELVHHDAFKQCDGRGLVTTDGRDFSCYQLNMCEMAAKKARAALKGADHD